MAADSYLDVSRASPEVGRQQEGQAFDDGIALMKVARNSPQDVGAAVESVRYMQSLWGFLIRDLNSPQNDLSDELKANLISIGLWVLRECDLVLAGHTENWDTLIEINMTVREGLSK
ncbi:MAG: flagellar biosynthesis regulator FlaF [Pseudomonadota bacterium]